MELIQRASGGSVNMRLPQLNNKKTHHPKPAVLSQQRFGGEDAQEDAPSQFSCASPGAEPSPAGSSSLGGLCGGSREWRWTTLQSLSAGRSEATEQVGPEGARLQLSGQLGSTL